MDWRSLDHPRQFAPMCSRCGWTGQLRDTILHESGPHIKATCPECDTYLCFAKRRADHHKEPAPAGRHQQGRYWREQTR